MVVAPPAEGGGELVKAKICVVEGSGGSDPGELEFQFNPSAITIEKHALKAKQGAKGSDANKPDDQASEPWKIHIKDVVFDTYEQRENVKTQADAQEKGASTMRQVAEAQRIASETRQRELFPAVGM